MFHPWVFRIGRCSTGSAGRVSSLGPKSSLVCLKRTHACHVLYWAVVSSLGRGLVARCHLFFSTRSLRWHQGCVLSPVPALAPCRSHVLNHLGFGPRCLSGMFSTPLYKIKLPPMRFVCLFFLCLGDSGFPDQFFFEAIDLVWYSGQAGGEKQLTTVSSCSVSTIGVVVVDVSGDFTAMFQLWSSANFDLRT